MTDHVMRILNRYRDNDVKVNLFEITASDCFRINTNFPIKKAKKSHSDALEISSNTVRFQKIYCIESNS